MINRGNQDWHFMPAPGINLEGETPVSDTFNDIYYSPEDGIRESEHVFINGSDLVKRIVSLSAGETLTLVELGVGTGLNCLMTAQAWLQHRPPGARLRYIAIDAFPMRQPMLEALNTRWASLSGLAETLIKRWPAPLPGCHRRTEVFQDFSIDFWWEDAASALGDLASHGRRWVDIWYLDGFSPKTNAAMWSDAVFGAMQQLSRGSAVIASFTASGDIRRRLDKAGFSITKRTGFGRKRECITGKLREAGPTKPRSTPWDIAIAVATSPQQIAIVGAGIAGAQVARQLADRGCRVRVFDAARVATGASCQSQGITYTRVSHKFGKLPDFAGLSFVHAVDTYQQLIEQGELEADKQVQLNGYLQLVKGGDQQVNFETVLSDPQGHATLLSSVEASAKAGVGIDRSAVFFPTGGWLDLPELCQTLLKHKNITVIENTGTLTLKPSIGQTWLLIDSEERVIARESQVVLATAHDTDKQVDLDWLPLQPIRGQTSFIDAHDKTNAIAIPICHEGYIAPARDGQHCIGASYHPNNESQDISEADHQHNTDQLQAALGHLFDETGISVAGGSAAIRCATADYLPIVGFAPVQEQFREIFAPLAQDRKKLVDADAPAHPGLWLCCGFGSRGLSATPIAASLLVSQIFGEPPPLPRYLQQAVSPARFLQRSLVKGNNS